MVQNYTVMIISSATFGLNVSAVVEQQTQEQQSLPSTAGWRIDVGIFLLVSILVCAFIYFYFSSVKSDLKLKRSALHSFSPKEQSIILIMASAAKSDKEIASSEVNKIRAVIQKVSGRNVTISDIEKVLKLASSSFNKRDIQGAISEIGPEEKRELLSALFAVIAADGILRKKEYAFSKRFCQDLDIDQTFFDQTWVEYFEKNPQRLTAE